MATDRVIGADAVHHRYSPAVIGAVLLLGALQATADSALAERARRWPDSSRLELQRLFARAAFDSTDGALTTARRIGNAYAIAWRDSFFVRRVAYFSALTREQR